jgi:LPXTG-motif cell wall-anchored protein
MHRIPIRTLSFAGIILATSLSPAARADAWDKKTTITFSESVEVPGAVLAPGQYVMKLHNSPSNRHIVEFWNDRQDHLYSLTFAIPAERLRPAEHTILTFYEAAAGQPQALKTWYYPGDTIGQEFLYPNGRFRQVSQVTRDTAAVAGPAEPSKPQPAPAIVDRTPEPDRTTAQTAPAPAVVAEPAPAPEPELLAQNNAPPAPETPQQNAQAAPDNSANTQSGNSEQELPKTGSSLPLIGFAGLAALASALVMRRIA